jgi:hypothetical protein
MPLPHLGIMKEARVCDICTRQLFQRRAGVRSPQSRQPRVSLSGDELVSLVNDLTFPASPMEPPASAGSPRRKLSRTAAAAPPLATATATPPPSLSAEEPPLPGSSSGVLYSCLLEEQANIVDDILYLGTFTMGGRALASRHMNGNVALWKDRWFMLTSAEMLTFKATENDEKGSSSGGNATVAALGELRSSVHLTDILHIEINEQYPRNLTVIRSDGRVFRVRAKTPEQCHEIATALRKAQQLFQDAMHKLQRGVRDEDYSISCVTIQHESSLVEHVVMASPLLGEKMHVEMYPSSILRFYVNGPEANGVAQYSSQMLSAESKLVVMDSKRRVIFSDADPLRSSPSDSNVLRVALRPSPLSSTTHRFKEQKRRAFWTSMAALVAAGAYLNLRRWTFLEVIVWLTVLVLGLTRYHDPVLLFLTTKRIHRAKRFCVECVGITYERKAGSDGDNGDRLGPEDAHLDPRFLEGCNGDLEEAKVRYAETLKWREAEKIDSLLLRPLPSYAAMKASYVHFCHKKDKRGHIVSFDHFGYVKKMREEFLARGVSEAEAVMHQIFLQEFMWQVIDPRPYPEGKMLKVFDIKGISMGDVSGDVFNFMKMLGTTIADYNPERIHQVFIVNPPSWFNLLWKLASPSINPKTRERIHVVRGQKEIAKALLEFVHEEDLPVEYGGKCNCQGGCFTHSPEERDMREFVENYLNAMEEGDPRIQQALDALKTKYHQQLAPYTLGAIADGNGAATTRGSISE